MLQIALIGCIAEHVHCQEINFDHITTDGGLISGNVRTILEDYQGFFWFGTEDGLQRYDGYSMHNYFYDEKDTTTLSSNYILYLFEDSRKNLWVGTLDAGLCLYDRDTDSFKRFINNPADKNSILGNYVRVIFESSDSIIYIGLEEGGFSYFKTPSDIPSSINFTNVAIPRIDHAAGANMVCSIIEDTDHTLLVGVNGSGLNRFNPATGAFQRLLQDSCSNRIHHLLLDSKNRLWVGSWDKGIYIYDRLSKRIVHHVNNNLQGSLSQNQIESIFEDREGNFWIGTDNGLCLMPFSTDPFSAAPFITYRHNEFESSSLLSNSIKAFLMDKQNRVWIGSYYGGINIYNKSAAKFLPVRNKPWSPSSLSDNNVFSFAEDKQGNLWVGTDGGGLNLLTESITEIGRDNFKKVPIELDGKPVNKIKCLETDRQGNLWIGTWGSGIFKLNTKTYSYEHYGTHPTLGKGISADEVLTIKADSLDNLWIGAFNGGLNYFDQKRKTFTQYTNFYSQGKSGKIIRILSVHISRDGKVWVSREVGGLNLFYPETQSFKAVELGILDKYLTILSIHEDRTGALWLGTNSIGLIRYDPNKGEVKLFNVESGLANNVVQAILEDTARNTLWVSTNKGLSAMDISSGAIVNYTKADGLQGNQFNPGSAYLHSSGLMLFGGISGMNVFDPAKIKKSKYLPPVIFTRFWLDNEEAGIHNPQSPLSKNVILDQTINLDYIQNSFSIEFTMLEYDFAHRNEYSYFLEGFNTTWQNIGTERKATFTNLDPATYLLKVRARNSDGLWTQQEKTVTIVIHPAWWQTTVFKIALLLIIILITLIVFRIRIRYLIRQQTKLQLLVAKRTDELKQKNDQLAEKIGEIKSQNDVLYAQKMEILTMNEEIQAQNEELTSQNDQINVHRDSLKEAQDELKQVNDRLEMLVLERTKKLEATIAELDKTVAELDRFVYSASHDLSAPLKSVLGLVNIAKIEKNHDTLQKYYIYIETSIQKLDSVIKNLVEFSRNSHQEVNIANVDAHHLIEEVLHELAFWPEAGRIKFLNKLAPGQIVMSDRDRLKVVLHNLVANGIKYADFTKPDSFIQIETSVFNSHLVLSVHDNGIGIERDKQAKIFDMYYRGTDRSKGSGLGLFIVKEILLKVGATIEVTSDKGKGATFTMIFKDGAKL